jgi:predicted ATP-dependent endonuclease of OLD family
VYIKEFTIRNYRNFRNVKFFFKDGSVNTVLGENASGKTNLFNAMRLILDDSLPQNEKYLNESDFHSGLKSAAGHWVVFKFVFGGLGDSDEDLVMANHTMKMTGDCRDGNYTYIYRPKIHIRKSLYDLTVNEPNVLIRKSKVEEYLSGVSIDREYYEAVSFVRGEVDYLYDDQYEKVVGNFYNYIFPDPGEESATLLGVCKPAYFSLVKEVSCTYVKALRNVVSDMKYSKTNPLYKLLVDKSKDIDGAEDIERAVKELNSNISNLDQVKGLSVSIRETLLKTIGKTYSPSLDITSDLPEKIKDLIQSLMLVVEDSYGYQGTGKIEDLSLGGANLIYLALKLYEYESVRESDEKIAHFLFIEEPEAHIHNHIQKTLFSNLSLDNTQVIISTHSTQISSVSNVSSMNIISRKKESSDVFWPSNGLDESSLRKIERYLDSTRSTLLFAKSVMLVEGDAENILIPVLVKKVLGVSLDELGISLIKMDGTVFKHISSLFEHNRIRNNCAIVTDRDAPFLSEANDYASLDYIVSLRNADKDGIQRFNELRSACESNQYLESFFAQTTFETGLIMAGNSDVFIETLSEVYSQKSRADAIKKRLNGTDEEKCYFALKLANKVGKGWYAILLSEKIHSGSKIPSYILMALKYLIPDSNKMEINHEIMKYRLGVLGLEYDLISGETIEQKINSFILSYPNDPLRLLVG